MEGGSSDWSTTWIRRCSLPRGQVGDDVIWEEGRERLTKNWISQIMGQKLMKDTVNSPRIYKAWYDLFSKILERVVTSHAHRQTQLKSIHVANTSARYLSNLQKANWNPSLYPCLYMQSIAIHGHCIHISPTHCEAWALWCSDLCSAATSQVLCSWGPTG